MTSCKNVNLFVSYDMSHNKVFSIAGIEIIRPDEWEAEKLSEDAMKQTESNVNKLDVHPQIATVLIPNLKFPFKKGDKVFLHYMAFEWAERLEIEGESGFMIDAEYVLFVMEDGKYIMPKDYYLGEQVYAEAERTASGIYVTPFDTVKKAMEITITHKPQGDDYVGIGDTVYSVDDKQYVLKVDGKEYVWLKKSEIIAKKEDIKQSA